MSINTAYLTAGMVMDKSAALNNDVAKERYTYEVQLPYLNMALEDLRKKLEYNNAPVTDTVTSDPIIVPAGVTVIKFNNPSGPSLPKDLIQIQQLWSSWDGGNNYIPMTKVDGFPLYLEGVQTNQWTIWVWQSNEIRLLAATGINNIKIQYIRNLFADIENPTDNLAVINADSYLQFRTGGLLAEFVGEESQKAMSLNAQALDAFDTMIGIDNKGRQDIATRRRPFRASFKRRGVW